MKNRITVLLLILTILLSILCLTTYMFADRMPPEITVPEGEFEYEEGADEAILLEGVSAMDDRDGDISSSVRIYDVAVMDSHDSAMVIYAVYDSSNNLGKASKIVKYISASGKKGEIFAEEATATDAASDTDTSAGKKDTASSENAGSAGKTQEATTGEQPETTAEPDTTVPDGFDDPPLVSEGAPVMRITTHQVKMAVGGHFYSMDYVDTAVDDVDTKEMLYENMYMDGYYSTRKQGEYELTYYCVDSDGNVSNKAKLILIVY